MKTVITIKAVDLFSCAIIAPSDDSRSYLNGVYINQECMISADGHRLIKIPHDQPSENKFEMVIPIECIKSLKLSAKEKSQADVSILETEDGNFLTSGSKQVYFKPIKEKYPQYERVIPDRSKLSGELGEMTFNWDYMSDFSKIAKLNGDRSQSVKLIPDRKNAAMCEIKVRPDYVCVIMPIHW